MLKSIVKFLCASCLLISTAYAADSFKLGIMQAQKGEAAKYAPFAAYFKSKGIDVYLVGFGDYTDAAKKFATGEVDALVSGSGVAGTMIMKDLAEPLVRPVNKTGFSTYWAVVIAPKGAPKFDGKDAKYFDGKKVVCTALASSGEFFARALGKKDNKIMASHGAALEALNAGAADLAVVKNRVWDAQKNKFPKLEMVGQDTGGENPDNTLIVSKKMAKPIAEKIKTNLLALESDNSNEALKLKESLEIVKFISTNKDDFKHNLELLKSAGVSKDFNFSFN